MKKECLGVALCFAFNSVQLKFGLNLFFEVNRSMPEQLLISLGNLGKPELRKGL